MPQVSVTFNKGKGSLAHNNRDFVSPNVDPERIKDDIVYKQQPLEEAYEECFGAAIEEYDKKQKRADRKIGGVAGYMNRIKNSGNGEKLFYENVVMIGSMYTCNVKTANGEIAKKILDEYMREFQVRNPNLYVFNAVLHLDEETPHLHIDYIPVAEGYKNGMQKRNSLDKALKQQGVAGKANRFENSTVAWEQQERKVLAAAVEREGWEYVKVESERDDLSLSQYKAMVEVLNNAVAVLPDQIEKKPVPLSKDKVIVSATDLEALEQRAKFSLVHEEVTKTIKEKTEELRTWERSALSSLEGELQTVRSRVRDAEQERREARIERNDAENEKRKFKQAYQAQVDLNKHYKNLYNRYNALKDENAALQTKVDQAEAAKEAAVKPLEAKIKEQEQTISNLSFFMNALLQLARYVRDRFAGRLSDAFLSAAIKRSEEQLARDGIEVSRVARVSSLYRKDIALDDLSYRRGEEGKGLYSSSGTFVYAAESIKEAREAFPNCKIKNEIEKNEHVR